MPRNALSSPKHTPSKSPLTRKRLLTSTAVVIGLAGALAGAPARAGTLAQLHVVARHEAAVLPMHAHEGRQWVVGAPGQEFSLRVCNSTAGRLLAVTSVDGVNVITGETATPQQSGYVVDAYACVDIAGWRKSMARTAAFYFTELPDSYAARTGRPDNLGVIGVALFREKLPPPVVWRAPAKVAAEAQGDAAAASGPEPSALGEARRARDDAAPAAAAPRTMLGTGHGRSEYSRAQQVAFERETTQPAETLAIQYDRRENLVAMGILPRPVIARSKPANPFPGWPNFVPDPPRR